VLDVGFLFVSCDTRSRWTPHLDRNPACMPAVVDGYCRHRLPASAEFDGLVDAMRVRAIVHGAVSFAEAIAEPGRGDDEAWWRERYQTSDELAACARARFEWGLLESNAEKGAR
jgi:hypothetical protein